MAVNANNETPRKKVAKHLDLWLHVAVIVSSVFALLHPLIGLLTATLAICALFISRSISKEKDVLLGKLDSLTANIANQTTSIASQTTNIANQVEAIQNQRGQRYFGYANPRSLDAESFVHRLNYRQRGLVTLAYPQNRPQPIDDFAFRLYDSLKEARWPVSSHFGESHDVSAYGVTLKVVVENKDVIPPHLHTLKYALEKSGCPVSIVIDIQDRTCEEVFLIIGAELP